MWHPTQSEYFMQHIEEGKKSIDETLLEITQKKKELEQLFGEANAHLEQLEHWCQQSNQANIYKQYQTKVLSAQFDTHMSQANPFMITAVDTPRTLARNLDQELNADELKVLRQKLHAWQEAFRRRAEIEIGTGREPMNNYISWQLSEYDRMLSLIHI